MKLRLSPCAELIEYPSENPTVLFEGRRYRQRELVPPQIRGDSIGGGVVVMESLSAREFVEICMTEQFGDSDNWPALARNFALA